MTTLELRGADLEQSNIKDFDLERNFYAAWEALYRDSNFHKKCKITATGGEIFEVDIRQIWKHVFEECGFIDANLVMEELNAGVHKEPA